MSKVITINGEQVMSPETEITVRYNNRCATCTPESIKELIEFLLGVSMEIDMLDELEHFEMLFDNEVVAEELIDVDDLLATFCNVVYDKVDALTTFENDSTLDYIIELLGLPKCSSRMDNEMNIRSACRNNAKNCAIMFLTF